MLKRNYELTKQNWLVYGLGTVPLFNRFWFWKKSFRAFRERVPRVWISLKHQNYFRVICNCYHNCDHIFILYTVSAWVVGRAIRLLRNTVEFINLLFLLTASGYLKIMYSRSQGNSPLSSAKLGDIYAWMRRSLKETVLSHKLNPYIGKSRYTSYGGLSIWSLNSLLYFIAISLQFQFVYPYTLPKTWPTIDLIICHFCTISMCLFLDCQYGNNYKSSEWKTRPSLESLFSLN